MGPAEQVHAQRSDRTREHACCSTSPERGGVGKRRRSSATHSEQQAIAAFLDRETARIDGLVAKKERLIELLQEKRAAFITRAVTKGLDPTVPMKDSGVEWLGQIPAHWDVKRIAMMPTVGTDHVADVYAGQRDIRDRGCAACLGVADDMGTRTHRLSERHVDLGQRRLEMAHRLDSRRRLFSSSCAAVLGESRSFLTELRGADLSSHDRSFAGSDAPRPWFLATSMR